MKINEIQKEKTKTNSSIKGPGWLNIESKKWIPIKPEFSHSLAVVLTPEKFGFSRNDLVSNKNIGETLLAIQNKLESGDLNKRDFFEKLSQEFDGNKDIIDFMSNKGWVRVIHKDERDAPEETNIQATDLKQVHRAAKLIGDIEVLSFDAGLDFGFLYGDKLDFFLKKGRVPSHLVYEDATDDTKSKATGTGYSAYVLTPESRKMLLNIVEPVYPDVIAHHITYEFGVPLDSDLPPEPKDVKVIGYTDNHHNIQALVVSVNGTHIRPDGQIYHITWSIDRSKGATPKLANSAVARRWEKLVSEIPIEVTPAILK